MTMTHPIRLGLIGYGYAGKTFHAPLIAATPGLQLAAVASSNAGKVHADLPGMRVIDDPQQLIHDDGIDLVVIATPNDTHAPLASDALRAGKHVVLDKPMALDLAEARALIALADASPGLLSVFHNRRWDSDYLAVKQAHRRRRDRRGGAFRIAYRPLPPRGARPLARVGRPRRRHLVRPRPAPGRSGAAAVRPARAGAGARWRSSAAAATATTGRTCGWTTAIARSSCTPACWSPAAPAASSCTATAAA